jgi:hypothetical protein
MTIPSILLGSIIALLMGALFHLWRGGGFIQLVVYLAAALIGFWVGHGIGDSLDLEFLSYGPLHLGLALIGGIAFLGLAYWLSLTQDTYY